MALLPVNAFLPFYWDFSGLMLIVNSIITQSPYGISLQNTAIHSIYYAIVIEQLIHLHPLFGIGKSNRICNRSSVLFLYLAPIRHT